MINDTPTSTETKPKKRLTYQFYIALLDVEPVIWRRFRVPDNISFATLHEIIQVVMGWDDYHLYEFRYGPYRIGLPDEDYFPVSERNLDAARRKLSPMKFQHNDLLTYTYDFGDDWIHMLRVEGTLYVEDPMSTIHCISGARACPPEDVGGVYGYQQFVRVMNRPGHPEHEQFAAWYGQPFDAELFDVEQVNQRLQRFRRGRR